MTIMAAQNAETAAEVTAMPDADFAAFVRLVRDHTGIVLTESKRWMLTSRLTREIRRLNLPDFASYRRLLEQPGAADQLQSLISAVTTNVTSFFRGADQFDTLAQLVPGMRERVRRGGRVRLWSAGCSTGQEPYSIAMTLLDQWPEVLQADVLILATDIDAAVVQTARRGIYDARELDEVANPLLRKFTAPGPQPGTVVTAPPLREMIRFERLNMLEPWPFSGQFDVIFCRNVVIYFDAETRCQLWQRFAERLDPGGWLFVGHSERVAQSLEGVLKPSGVTRYRRTDRPIPSGRASPS